MHLQIYLISLIIIMKYFIYAFFFKFTMNSFMIAKLYISLNSAKFGLIFDFKFKIQYI